MTRPLLAGLAVAFFSLLPLNCASHKAIPRTPVQEDHARLAEFEKALRNAARELELLHAGKQPDCARACHLGDTICDLASRICRISEHHPEHPEIQAKCLDAGRRCNQARIKVGKSCQCSSGT